MRILAAVLILGVWPVGAAPAQWYVGLEIGTAQYRGSTRDTSGSASGAYLRPGGATSYGLHVARDAGVVRITVRAAFSRSGIAATAQHVTVTDRSTGDLLEVTPLAAVRVARVGPGGALRVEAGPAVGLWDIEGEIHARVAALAALLYDWPVAGRLGGALRVEGVVGPSAFERDQVPPDLERRTMWRYGVTVGLRYRL